MKNLDIITGDLTIGKTTFHVPAMGNFTKDKFKETYTGLLSQDLNVVYEQIEQARKLLAKPKKVAKKAK